MPYLISASLISLLRSWRAVPLKTCGALVRACERSTPVWLPGAPPWQPLNTMHARVAVHRASRLLTISIGTSILAIKQNPNCQYLQRPDQRRQVVPPRHLNLIVDTSKDWLTDR